MAAYSEDVPQWTSGLARAFRRDFAQLRINCTQAMLIHELMDQLAESKPSPTVGELATHLGICRRAVRANLRQLEQAGYLKREQGRGGPNMYSFDGFIEAVRHMLDRRDKP